MNSRSYVKMKEDAMEDRYNVECCEFIHAHDEIVEKVQKEMPS